MLYFTYELISPANEWIDQTDDEVRAAERRMSAVIKKYQNQLDTLEPRLSRQAFQFFRFGYGSKSLHDARLLSANIGDGLDFTANGKTPFRLNRQQMTASVKFLNFEQD